MFWRGLASCLLAPTPNFPSLCRSSVTQRDDLEPVAGLGIAATMGGSKVAPGSKPRRHQQPDLLHSEIGRLKMELDWLKKSLE